MLIYILATACMAFVLGYWFGYFYGRFRALQILRDKVLAKRLLRNLRGQLNANEQKGGHVR